MIKFDDLYMKKRLAIAWRGPAIAGAIHRVLKPKSCYDFGCATGDIAKGLLDLGVDVLGIDNSEAAGSLLPPENFRQESIREGIRDIPRRDLGILLEVLSIMPKADHVPTLCTVVAPVNTLLINRLDQEDRILLEHIGFAMDPVATGKLKAEIEEFKGKQAFKALYNTGEVWQRNTAYGNPFDVT